MEIVLIRHGQPEWMINDEYQRNPGLTELGDIQSTKSARQFTKHSIDQIWVSPLNRAVQTLTPFETNEVAKEIKFFEWLKEMEDKDEVALYGKSSDEIMSFFEKRNSQTFEEWAVSSHGLYMQDFAKNIVTNLEGELEKLGIVCIDDTFDKKFEIRNNSLENLMIISHAGTMSVLLSYFLNMPLYAWTWKKFLPRHTGHTRLRSMEISDGHFFRLKEFNNVSFIENPEEQTY